MMPKTATAARIPVRSMRMRVSNLTEGKVHEKSMTVGDWVLVGGGDEEEG